ncbi:E3 ubiquitin-protein ligase [Smittium mucronatum]|uniref:RING-type E3 ubiquitin transferase n=1 Tax=Smittium mucronatum TaxID=133383 RepID=A0A1R0H848_9FUNG|nr:E3 ubiquitin-protein ligase [Smittium mucronatum]
MIKKSPPFIKKMDEKIIDLGSQEIGKDESNNMIEYTSKVSKNTISSAKNHTVGGGNDNIVGQEKMETIYDSDCLICFENINTGDDVRNIPCLHMFHRECLDQWLVERMGSCPNCRLDLRINPIQNPTSNNSEETPALPSETSAPLTVAPNQSATIQVLSGTENSFNSPPFPPVNRTN